MFFLVIAASNSCRTANTQLSFEILDSCQLDETNFVFVHQPYGVVVLDSEYYIGFQNNQLYTIHSTAGSVSPFMEEGLGLTKNSVANTFFKIDTTTPDYIARQQAQPDNEKIVTFKNLQVIEDTLYATSQINIPVRTSRNDTIF